MCILVKCHKSERKLVQTPSYNCFFPIIQRDKDPVPKYKELAYNALTCLPLLDELFDPIGR